MGDNIFTTGIEILAVIFVVLLLLILIAPFLIQLVGDTIGTIFTDFAFIFVLAFIGLLLLVVSIFGGLINKMLKGK